MRNISILGAGWLGFPLAQSLLALKQHALKVSTTSTSKIESLKKEGFEPYIINSDDYLNNTLLNDFLICDILIINIPPKKSNQNYLVFLKFIASHKALKRVKQIIFISSSSVYPLGKKTYNEDEDITVENSSKEVVYKAERIFLNSNTPVNILRCSGLMGYSRVAGRYFENKKVPDENAKVNYVHRDDVIAAIVLLIQNECKNSLYNLCSLEHPSKKEVYLRNSEKLGFSKPIFDNLLEVDVIKSVRLIDGSRISKEMGFEYKFPNPLEY